MHMCVEPLSFQFQTLFQTLRKISSQIKASGNLKAELIADQEYFHIFISIEFTISAETV